jgi:hypothetical protein
MTTEELVEGHRNRVFAAAFIYAFAMLIAVFVIGDGRVVLMFSITTAYFLSLVVLWGQKALILARNSENQ